MARKQIFTGVNVTPITPFNGKELNVDVEGLRRNINFLIKSGIKHENGLLIPCGSNGECYAMTNSERKKVVEIVIEEAEGKARVIPGCNHTGTALVIDLVKHSEKAGADGIMVAPPYYLTPSEKQILNFYRDIAEAVDIGIMVYDFSEITGVEMSVEILGKLAEIENVVALKSGLPSFESYTRYIRELGDQLACISNTFSLIGAGYMHGAKGFVSGFANFIPERVVDIHKAAVNSKWKKVAKLEQELNSLVEFCNQMVETHGPGGGIMMLQAATKLAGNSGGTPRPPLSALSNSELSELSSILEDLNVL